MNGFESTFSLAAGAFRTVTTPDGFGVAVWVLAIVFAWSGLAKLRRPTLAAIAIMDFGFVRRIRPRLGIALGAAELLLALVLVSGALPAIFLPVTAGVLWCFVLVIARSLWAGRRFACFCFGDANSELSRRALVRTAALALLASILAVYLSSSGEYANLSDAYALQAVSAGALIGALVLASQLPRLVRWNSDPYEIGVEEAGE